MVLLGRAPGGIGAVAPVRFCLFDNEVRLPKERYFYQGRCYNRLRKDELVPVQIRMG